MIDQSVANTVGTGLRLKAMPENSLFGMSNADAQAWAKALDGLDFARCEDAIVKHYRENTERLMPAHIRRLARTTTDITHGATAATAPATSDGDVLCGDCKLMHRPAEHCTVLVADDSRWRKAVNMFRRPTEIGADR